MTSEIKRSWQFLIGEPVIIDGVRCDFAIWVDAATSKEALKQFGRLRGTKYARYVSNGAPAVRDRRVKRERIVG